MGKKNVMVDDQICSEKDELHHYCTTINPLLESFRCNTKVTPMEIDYFRTSDGFPLFYRIWRPTPIAIPKKIVLCIHGLHSHGEKFVLLADAFIENNWHTYAIDLRGHGLSWIDFDNRGDVPEFTIWIEDLKEFLSDLRFKYPYVPIYIVAESMGAALSLHVAKTKLQGIQALILISPALKAWKDIQFSMILEAFTFAIFKHSEKSVIPHKGDQKFSTNSDKYIEYQLKDPLRITNVSPRYYYQVIKMIHNLKNYEFDPFYPCCMFFGEKDHLIDFEGLKIFTKDLNNTPKALHYIPEAFHDLLTDDEARKYDMCKKILNWISEY